jgi:hypothetical protein
MRVFAECDLLKYLAAAGLSEIEVHRNPFFQYGIWWARLCSFPISARKSTIALEKGGANLLANPVRLRGQDASNGPSSSSHRSSVV